MSARLMEPRSIVEAGRRFFGSWSATLEAAGLDPAVATVRPSPTKVTALHLHHWCPACTTIETFLDSERSSLPSRRGSFSRSR